MSKRLVLTSYFDPGLKEQRIDPLLFQPLVENAFKHVRGDYKINIELRVIENEIRCTIENTFDETSAADSIFSIFLFPGYSNIPLESEPVFQIL